MIRAIGVLVVVVAALWAAPARADSDEPQTYVAFFDATFNPHPENPKGDVYIEGDSLTIHVDPTRMFPSAKTPLPGLGFAASRAPPQARGFYVTATSAGRGREVYLQPGSCGLDAAAKRVTAAKSALADLENAAAVVQKDSKATPETKAAAGNAVEDAKAKLATCKAAADNVIMEEAEGAGTCVEAFDWHLENGATGYICSGDRTLEELSGTNNGDWSVVKRRLSNAKPPKLELHCLHETHLTPGSPVALVTAQIVNGGNAPESVAFVKDKDLWTATMAMKRNTREIRLMLSYEDGTSGVMPLKIQARARDSHSLVRIQGEIMSTNRLRTVAFAVAITPVRRAFFTDGPSWHCKLLCGLTPQALIRLSGDDKTLVQFGGGLGLNLSRAFQINGGVLFGTTDSNTAWRLERNWYFGIAVDPLILSETISGSATTKKE